MPCKIYLRRDQTPQQMKTCQRKDVYVYAPSWVREGLTILGKELKNIEFQVHKAPPAKRGWDNATPPPSTVLDSFTITKDFNKENLVFLQRIARNEFKSITGIARTSFYLPDIQDTKLIYAIKDLARQTIIVGKDTTTHYGGFKSPRVEQPNEPVYICDLAALQFQQPFNSGKLVLIQESQKTYGLLDEFIFEKVVGEKKRTFKDVVAITTEIDRKRYIRHEGFTKRERNACFLDSTAYKKFVTLDVVLSGTALAEVAASNGDKLNFKFLKYGTGHFAGKFGKELDSLILSGVVDGMEALFASGDENVLKTIKHLEFTFYHSDSESIKRLQILKDKYKVDYRFSIDDAVKQTLPGKGLITAVTNCANSNVACGNAMGLKSVDGAISENLISKGNIFCPNMNKLIEHRYLNIDLSG